jgi:hypothetical protein
MPQKRRPLIFTALSKHNFYFKEQICKYVFENGGIPISAFMAFGYFLWDLVSRKETIYGGNRLIEICDQLWVFGNISPGVAAEIKTAKKIKSL